MDHSRIDREAIEPESIDQAISDRVEMNPLNKLSSMASLNVVNWNFGLCLIALAVLISPFSIDVSIGQDSSASISVSRPAAGVAPSPGTGTNVPDGDVNLALNTNEDEAASSLSAASESTPQADLGDVEDASETLEVADAIDSQDTKSVTSDSEASDSEASDETDLASDGSEVASDDEFASLDEPLLANKDEIRELSVEPGTKPILPKDRPAWIGAPADLSGKNHRLYVGSVAMAEEDQTDRALGEPLIAAVNQYIDEHLVKEQFAGYGMQINEKYIRNNLVVDSNGYLLQLNTSQGPMFQKWVTLEITPEQQAQIKAWHNEAVQRDRIAPLGLGLVGVIGFVGLMHLVLRRKGTLPTSQPFDAKQMVAAQKSVEVEPKRRGGLSALMILFCIFCLPGMLFLSLAVPVYQSRKHEHIRRLEAVQEVPLLETSRARGTATQVILKSKSEALPEVADETRIESNGQVIIIREGNS